MSLVDRSAAAWAEMGISKNAQIERLIDLANMLEERLMYHDPLYFHQLGNRSYVYDPNGRFKLTELQEATCS